MKELEGRFFGSQFEMEMDIANFLIDNSISNGTYNNATRSYSYATGFRELRWYHFRERWATDDVIVVAGIKFAKVMFDKSLDYESMLYVITRLRS